MNLLEPDALPMTTALAGLLAEVDEFKGRWKAITWLSPEVLGGLRRSATIESVGSSTRIEGSELSDPEVETVLANALETESFATRDEQEVAGYARAMEMIFDSSEILPATENHIRQLHRVLLQFSEKDERHRGDYKAHPNRVAAFDSQGKEIGVIFETSSPFATPGEMEALTAWLMRRETQRDLHPLLVAGIYTVTFLKIHPFQDGNGRLSRVLTALLLLRAGYAYLPYASLESIVEQNKDAYYRALRATQRTMSEERTDWLPWLKFFLLALKKQTVALGRRIDALHETLNRLSSAERELLELLESRGRLAVAEAVAVTGQSRNTIRKRLAGLVDKGFLALEGKGRGAGYRKR